MSSKKSSQEQGKSARQPPEYLVVGRVVRPHGVRGTLVVEPVSRVIDSLVPGAIVFLGDDHAEYKIENIRAHHKRFLVTLDRINDRTEAEEYRDLNVKLDYQDSEPLDEDEYYYWQILGLRVETNEGEHLGEVIDIIETGANDVYVVRRTSGEELLIPAIDSVILDVDLENERLVVELLPGLLGG